MLPLCLFMDKVTQFTCIGIDCIKLRGFKLALTCSAFRDFALLKAKHLIAGFLHTHRTLHAYALLS